MLAYFMSPALGAEVKHRPPGKYTRPQMRPTARCSAGMSWFRKVFSIRSRRSWSTGWPSRDHLQGQQGRDVGLPVPLGVQPVRGVLAGHALPPGEVQRVVHVRQVRPSQAAGRRAHQGSEEHPRRGRYVRGDVLAPHVPVQLDEKGQKGGHVVEGLGTAVGHPVLHATFPAIRRLGVEGEQRLPGVEQVPVEALLPVGRGRAGPEELQKGTEASGPLS